MTPEDRLTSYWQNALMEEMTNENFTWKEDLCFVYPDVLKDISDWRNNRFPPAINPVELAVYENFITQEMGEADLEWISGIDWQDGEYRGYYLWDSTQP